jgi:hypothetical protein
MVPKNLIHMYADNFWKDLGKNLNIIKYFNEVIFEHLHPDNGKALNDTQYEESSSVFSIDRQEYDKYINVQFEIDVQKVKELL